MKKTIKTVALLLSLLMITSVLGVFGAIGASAASSEISTPNVASIRLSTENSGIRFKTDVSKAYIEQLKTQYGEDKISVGTIIAPTDTIAGLAEFTKAALDDAKIPYVDVKATLNRPYDSDDTVNTYTGSLTNIKTKNLQREFSAVGYVAVEGVGYQYSATTAQRAVYDVANIALSDLKAEAEGKYVNPTYVMERTFYSKYTAEQRSIILSFASEPNSPFEDDIFFDGAPSERELTEFEQRFSVQNEYLLKTYALHVTAGDVREDLPEFSTAYTSCSAAGNNGYTYVYEGATLDTYNAYLEALRSEYFAQYTDNQFDGSNSKNKNYFATFVSEITQVDIEFHAAASRMYVNATPRTESVLPERSAPSYTAAGAEYPTILTQFGLEDINTSDNSLGLIVRTADGSFVILDSGENFDGVEERIYDILCKQAPDANDIVISAWILTHAHADHVGGFERFVNQYGNNDNITIEQIVYNFPDDTLTPAAELNWQNRTRMAISLLGDKVEILKAHTGNVLYYADIKVNVLYTQENYLAVDTYFNNYNTASMVVQFVMADGTKVLVGSDHPVDGDDSAFSWKWCENALYNWYGSFIESYVCTPFHHGLGGGADENTSIAGYVIVDNIYSKIKPKVVLWCADQARIDLNSLKAQNRNKYFVDGTNGCKYYVAAGSSVQVVSFSGGVATVTEYADITTYLAS